MIKKFNFVYITTDISSGKQYIGDHSTNNLEDGYLGSGLHIKRAIKKSGKENFKREIIELFETKEEAFNAQERYINEYNTLAPNGYNISPKGGGQISGGFSEDTKQKISEILINEKLCSGKKNGMFGKKHSKKSKEKIALKSFDESHGLFGKSGEDHPNFGRTHTKEAKNKISLSSRGRKHTDESKKKISKGLKGKIDVRGKNNPMSGKKHSEESKRKMREKALLRNKNR